MLLVERLLDRGTNFSSLKALVSTCSWGQLRHRPRESTRTLQEALRVLVVPDLPAMPDLHRFTVVQPSGDVAPGATCCESVVSQCRTRLPQGNCLPSLRIGFLCPHRP
jgi:hypothetical protein